MLSGITVHPLAENRITVSWLTFDTAALLQQLSAATT